MVLTLRGAISLFVHTAVEEEINRRYFSGRRAHLQPSKLNKTGALVK